jgi:3-isopropylmalate/(R)-2-methylmalate dehydratase small subunit
MVLHFNHKGKKGTKKKATPCSWGCWSDGSCQKPTEIFLEKPLPLAPFYGYFDRLKINQGSLGMELKGKVHKFGDDINTDEIIPARYLNTSDPQELAKHAMEDADPEFVQKMQPGDFIVAGKNFGCGSSREHAPIALKAAGLSGVIAGSFARIFYRNSFNMGLPIFESAEAAQALENGQEISVDLDTGVITDLSTGKKYTSQPIPPFMQELLADGGLMAFVKKQLEAKSV